MNMRAKRAYKFWLATTPRNDGGSACHGVLCRLKNVACTTSALERAQAYIRVVPAADRRNFMGAEKPCVVGKKPATIHRQ
jgi:hypothetical protein